MTTQRTHTRKPLAVLGGIAILILVHSSMQESTATFLLTLPFLLMAILGELVREWTVGRLSPATDEDTARRRRQIGWTAGVAGIAFLTIPIVGLVAEWLPKRSLWVYLLTATSIVCLGVLAAVMAVSAQATINAKRTEAARAGQQTAFEPPGPLSFLLVLASALTLFALANATVIESLLSYQALSSAQWVRVTVSALLCIGLVFVIMRKLDAIADRPFDPANPDPT